jgi:hypothetical protein
MLSSRKVEALAVPPLRMAQLVNPRMVYTSESEDEYRLTMNLLWSCGLI